METTTNTENTIKANKKILDDLVAIQELRAEIKELQEKETHYKQHLSKIIHDYSLIVDKNGEKIASWAEVEFNRFDQNSFKESYPDLYGSFVKKSFEKRLNIYLKRRG